jgi:hypothetical protein
MSASPSIPPTTTSSLPLDILVSPSPHFYRSYQNKFEHIIGDMDVAPSPASCDGGEWESFACLVEVANMARVDNFRPDSFLEENIRMLLSSGILTKGHGPDERKAGCDR